MPYFPCNSCGKPLEINIGERVLWNKPNNASNPNKIIGRAKCRNCEASTGFEIINNTIAYISGKGSHGVINPNQSEVTKVLYAEAELCLQSGVPNAAATMCRASIEDALKQAGFEGRDLYQMVVNAKNANRLDDDEVGLANASRLITRDAIHRGELVNLSDIP